MIRLTDLVPGREEVRELPGSVGWSVYARDPERLMHALAGSDLVTVARDEDSALVGLVRTVSDGVSICDIQDLLVRPDGQRGGVGRALVERVREHYRDCALLVLTTDADGTEDAARSHPFYRALGFVPHDEQGLAAFALRP